MNFFAARPGCSCSVACTISVRDDSWCSEAGSALTWWVTPTSATSIVSVSVSGFITALGIAAAEAGSGSGILVVTQ
jgi:hypothetical protein